MIPAPLFAIIRYLVVWGCGWLVQHGWTIFSLDEDATRGVVEIICGVLTAVWMTGIGAWRSRVPVMLARFRAHHPFRLLEAAANVPGVQKIIASPAVANATPSDKVVSPTQV